MVAVMIALGLMFLLSVFYGDAVGAFVLGFVLLVLGWAWWSDRERGEGE